MITISEKLKIVMLRLGLTQSELADKLGVTQQTISKKFKYNNWRESDVKEICSVLNIECDMIFTLNDGTKV